VTIDPLDLNRRNWDDRARVHGQDRFYDSEALVAGASSLTEVEEEALRRAVGQVAGLEVIHLQCHIGFDSISLARAGARVTGLDFSQVSLAKAAALAERCGVHLPLVEADVCHPVAEVEARRTYQSALSHAVTEDWTSGVRTCRPPDPAAIVRMYSRFLEDAGSL